MSYFFLGGAGGAVFGAGRDGKPSCPGRGMDGDGLGTGGRGIGFEFGLDIVMNS